MSTVHHFFHRFLKGLAGYIYRKPMRILLLSVVLSLGSIYFAATHFKMNNSYTQLVDDSALLENYYAMEKEFGTDELYLVVIQSENPDLNRKVALEVGSFLETLKPQIARVSSKLDFSSLESRFLMLASKEELLEIEQHMTAQMQALQQASVDLDLNSVLDQANQSFDEKYLRKKDSWTEFKPFIERFKDILNQLANQIEGKQQTKPKAVFQESFSKNLAGYDVDIQKLLYEQQFISFQDGKVLLVTATRGEHEKNSTSPFTRTVQSIREFLKDLGKKYPTVKMGLTGEPVLNDDELRTSERDSQKAAVITLVLIAVLFYFSYRNLERPICAGLVLGMGMAMTFAFAMVVVGHFNVISLAVIPMVLGLGIDFGIQILGRYEEEIGKGQSVQRALETTLGVTGVAVLTGGSTTAAAFFTLCFNHFQGLRELGLIAGGSMVICLILNLVTLPAIFVIRDRRRSPAVLRGGAEISWSFLAPFDSKLVAHPKPVLWAAAVVTLCSLYGITKVKFDYNLLHLQNQKLESVQVLHELFRISDNSTLFASVIADSLDQARVLEEKLVKLPSVAKVESITKMIPSDQKEKRPIIQRISKMLSRFKVDTRAGKVDVVRAKNDLQLLLDQSRAAEKQAKKFQGISKQAREAVEVFSGLIPPLERALNAMKGLTQEELAQRLNKSQVEIFGKMKRNLAWLQSQKGDREIGIQDLPADIRQRFVSPSGKILLQVYAKGDIWEREVNKKFVDEVRTIAPKATGTPVQNCEYIEMLRVSFLDAAIWAFIAITLLIFLHFQSIKLSLLAISPLVLAVIWRTGMMGWLGIPFNPANVVTLPLIIGIDVAYGVYMVDRFREDQRITLFSTSTGKAIVMTGMTAFFGFVSLLVSDYEGMFSIGLLMSSGIAIGMFTTVVILPQLLAWSKIKA